MATPQKIANRSEALINALKANTELTLSERDDYIEIMTEAREGTNGLTTEEKTQANSENIANLCYLFIRHLLEGRNGSATSWKDVCVKCAWQIVAGIGIVSALLIFRPELGAVISGIFGK